MQWVVDLMRGRGADLAALAALGSGLALCSGLYGFMAGPVVKYAISTEPLVLPSLLSDFQMHSDLVSAHFKHVFPIFVVGAALAKATFSYFFQVKRCRLGHAVSRRLRAQLFRKIEGGQSDDLEAIGKGGVISRFIHDIDGIERFVSDGLIRGLHCCLEILCLFVLCLLLDWQLSVLFFLIYPLVLLPLLALTKRLKMEAKRSQAAMAASAMVFQEQVNSTKVIQSLGYPTVLRHRLTAAMNELYDASLRVVRLKSTSSPLAEVLGAVALCVTILVCGWRMSNGDSDGTFSISFMACLLLMYKPIKGLGELPHLFGPGYAAVQRLERFSELAVEHQGTHKPFDHECLIRLENVQLVRGGKKLFDNFSLELRRGDQLALSGPNGSGKSSLVDVFLGLRGTSAGKVYLGGVEYRELDLVAWRQWIGWVPQEEFLIEGSLVENVVMGRPGFDRNSVIECWRDLGFKMPDDSEFWDQTLKSEGHGLSGGELRKLLIARAFLPRPPILILDEPETFQDKLGKESLRATLSRVSNQHTVVMISHHSVLGFEPSKALNLGALGQDL